VVLRRPTVRAVIRSCQKAEGEFGGVVASARGVPVVLCGELGAEVCAAAAATAVSARKPPVARMSNPSPGGLVTGQGGEPLGPRSEPPF
jgi:hypothetical protein